MLAKLMGSFLLGLIRLLTGVFPFGALVLPAVSG
jgi:hypothetical protein